MRQAHNNAIAPRGTRIHNREMELLKKECQTLPVDVARLAGGRAGQTDVNQKAHLTET